MAGPLRKGPGVRESALLVWETLVTTPQFPYKQEGISEMKLSSGGHRRGAKDKDRRRRGLDAEARSLKRRLARAVAPNLAGPVLGWAGIVYEMAQRARGTAHGGMGLVAKLVGSVGLAGEIDSSLHLLSQHRPYYESDHVLNVAYNCLCGGRTLDDIELRRGDQVSLDGIGAASLPGPTTAGDFCRRFGPDAVMALHEAANRARLRVWAAQAPSFFDRAVIDADATIVPPGPKPKWASTSPTTAPGAARP